jgi:hypothetical protein
LRPCNYAVCICTFSSNCNIYRAISIPNRNGNFSCSIEAARRDKKPFAFTKETTGTLNASQKRINRCQTGIPEVDGLWFYLQHHRLDF